MPWRLYPGVKKARLRVFRSLRAAALAAEQKRPIVGLLTAHDAEQDSIALDPIIVALLQACRATDGQRSLRAVAQEANRQAPGCHPTARCGRLRSRAHRCPLDRRPVRGASRTSPWASRLRLRFAAARAGRTRRSRARPGLLAGPSFRACRQDCASPGGLGASSLAWGPLGQSSPPSKMRSM